MCLFLCANPSVYRLVETATARSSRQMLQLCALCPHDPYRTPDDQENEGFDYCDEPLVVRRFAMADGQFWRGRRFPQFSGHATSTYERHKTLEALANAWDRLLTFVGWRR